MKEFQADDYLKSMVDYLIHRQVKIDMTLANGTRAVGVLKHGVRDNYLLEVDNRPFYIQLLPIPKDVVFAEAQHFVTFRTNFQYWLLHNQNDAMQNIAFGPTV